MLLEADYIKSLPYDSKENNIEEIKLAKKLFVTSKKTEIGKNIFGIICSELKSVIPVGIIILVFNIPQINTLIGNFIPAIANNTFLIVLTKTLVGMLVYWLYLHFYLSKTDGLTIIEPI
jgi:hypothetical protein